MATYERVNWEDSPSRLTPINAENLNIMDAGLAALVDEFNGYITGENERIAELNDIKEQLERRIDALCEVPNIEKVREYVESDGYKIPFTPILTSDCTVLSPTQVMTNASFMIGKTVHLNFKCNNIGVTRGVSYVLLTLPEYARPSSEVSVIVSVNNTLENFTGWVRSSGEVVVTSTVIMDEVRTGLMPNTLPAEQLRICGSYLIA